MTDPTAPDLTLEQIAALHAKLDKISPGDWNVDCADTFAEDSACVEVFAGDVSVFDTLNAHAREMVYEYDRWRDRQGQYNAEAVVAVINAAPRLLAMAKRTAEAERNYRFMVERAADEKLDGYRELGSKCADLERRLSEATTKDERRADEIERLARTVLEFQGRLAETRDLICSAAPLAWANTPLSEPTMTHAHEWEKAASEWVHGLNAALDATSPVPDRCDCGGLYVGGLCVRCEKPYTAPTAWKETEK